MKSTQCLEDLWLPETTGIPHSNSVLPFRGHLVQLSCVTGVNTEAQKSQITLSTSVNG